VLDVANVVWCTGFRQVFDWIKLPIFGADGWPEEMRGVVSAAQDCSSAGWRSSTRSSSMVLPGVGRDAAYVAKQIDTRVGSFALAA
jgi:putative flavoprotein involved in K+ transport